MKMSCGTERRRGWLGPPPRLARITWYGRWWGWWGWWWWGTELKLCMSKSDDGGATPETAPPAARKFFGGLHLPDFPVTPVVGTPACADLPISDLMVVPVEGTCWPPVASLTAGKDDRRLAEAFDLSLELRSIKRAAVFLELRSFLRMSMQPGAEPRRW